MKLAQFNNYFHPVAVCPTGSEEVVLMAGSTDFTVTADGPTFDPPASTVDVNDALSGSGQSISMTVEDRIIVKPLCADMFILSAGVTVEGATEVEIMYLDDTGTQIDSFSVK